MNWYSVHRLKKIASEFGALNSINRDSSFEYVWKFEFDFNLSDLVVVQYIQM